MGNNDLRSTIINIYQDRAGHYDFTANLYYLMGYREWHFRKLTIGRMNLNEGDHVVEIGCGTGLNFGLVQERIGPRGKITGVDLTDAMLAQAGERVQRKGWKNVELVQEDARDFIFPPGVDGVYSTFALSLIPEAPEIIYRGADALNEDGHWALLDFEIPSTWPDWLVISMLFLIKPFTPIEDWMARKPWPEIQQAMEMALDKPEKDYYYLDITYLMSGQPER